MNYSTGIKEIGEAKRIEETYLVHIRGHPLEEAELIKYLIAKGYKQSEVAKMLGYSSQGQVSKRLRLLRLIPELQERVKNGELRVSTAYELSKLPEEKQKEFLGQEYVTLKEAQQAKREFIVTQELEELLESPIEIPEENESKDNSDIPSLSEILVGLEYAKVWIMDQGEKGRNNSIAGKFRALLGVENALKYLKLQSISYLQS